MDGLKQRIVGALVLISLAVIFVPMLFDEPHTERSTRTIELPEEPAFPSVDVPEPADQPAPVEEPPSFTMEEQPVAEPPQTLSEPQQAPAVNTESREPVAEPQPKPAPKPERTAATPEPAPKPASAANQPRVTESQPGGSEGDNPEYARALEGAWLVQLGSFGNADNALRLRNKVREKGYAAYTQSIERGDMTLTRVFSGPFVSENEALSAKSRLDKSFSLNSLVMEGDQ
ncbi:SPOR domain-containing protein [Marinobacter fonticola]|uniref:SPOR domain-containing protein n=1 Tax=Marinobacter fonticola TaxID=2603215 RepID=UPI0011E776E8|nr:SPOR domain-containing protein [Marinobacter fonticola]